MNTDPKQDAYDTITAAAHDMAAKMWAQPSEHNESPVSVPSPYYTQEQIAELTKHRRPVSKELDTLAIRVTNNTANADHNGRQQLPPDGGEAA